MRSNNLTPYIPDPRRKFPGTKTKAKMKTNTKNDHKNEIESNKNCELRWTHTKQNKATARRNHLK